MKDFPSYDQLYIRQLFPFNILRFDLHFLSPITLYNFFSLLIIIIYYFFNILIIFSLLVSFIYYCFIYYLLSWLDSDVKAFDINNSLLLLVIDKQFKKNKTKRNMTI